MSRLCYSINCLPSLNLMSSNLLLTHAGLTCRLKYNPDQFLSLSAQFDSTPNYFVFVKTSLVVFAVNTASCRLWLELREVWSKEL